MDIPLSWTRGRGVGVTFADLEAHINADLSQMMTSSSQVRLDEILVPLSFKLFGERRVRHIRPSASWEIGIALLNVFP